MDRSLVVVEPTDKGRELIELAGEIAAGTGTELVLLRILDEDEYERNLQRKEESSLGDVESIEELKDRAGAELGDLGEELLDDVSYRTKVLIGELPDDLLSEAYDLECDHIFITGEKRSPTGKVFFGDTTQAVLLNFDGPVTSLIR